MIKPRLQVGELTPAQVSGCQMWLDAALPSDFTELVTNGTFESDVTGWTAGTGLGGDFNTWERNTTTPIAGTGDAHGVDTGAVNPASRYASMSLLSGVSYTLTFRAREVSGTVEVRLVNSTDPAGSGWSGFTTIPLTSASDTDYSQVFTSGQAGTARLHLVTNALSSEFFIDSISLKETVLADGDPVGKWTDQSGTGNHGTQATAAKKPTWLVGGFSGKPCLSFDGTDDSFGNAYVPGTTYTQFAVVGTGAAQFGIVLSRRSNTAANPIHGAMLIDVDGAGIAAWSRDTAGAENLINFATKVGYPGTSLVTIVRDGNMLKLWRNGILLYEKTISMGATATTTTLIGAGVAGSSTETNFFFGKLAEMACWNSVLIDQDRMALEAYFLRKYGIS